MRNISVLLLIFISFFILCCIVQSCNNNITGGDDKIGNWTIVESGVTETLYDIDFIDCQNGWIVGEGGTILHTNNYGESWEPQRGNVDEFLSAVDFIDKKNGFVVGKNFILNTKDGGETWNIQFKKDLEDGYFRDIYFFDKDTGFIVGGEGFLAERGVLYRTNTGGETWEHVGEQDYSTLTAISFVDKKYGWICGSSGTILSTTNGGQTWKKQNLAVTPRPFLRSIQFVDRYHGWTASRDDWLGFYRTTDGGNTWIRRSEESLWILGVQTFFFIDSLNGWLGTFPGGDDYAIAKTTDGGQTWQFQEQLGISRIHSFCFLNKELGWAVGLNGIILKYTN